MDKTEGLLAKALSTSSEDEAIACLRMARKRGGTTPKVEAPTPDSIHQLNESVKLVRKENALLREYIRMIESRYNALQQQNSEISTKYHNSLATSLTLLMFFIGFVMITALL